MSRELAEVSQLKSSLQKALEKNSLAEAIDITTALNALPIQYSTLVETKVGATVNQLKKRLRESEKSDSLVVDLLDKWKKIYQLGAQGTSKSISAASAQDKKVKMEERATDKSTDEKAEKSSLKRAVSGDPDEEAEFDALSTVRRQAVELFKSHLLLSTNANVAASLAFHIEGSINDLHPHSDDSKSYTAKVRSLASNLKRNEQLRVDIVEGVLAPQNLVHLTPSELATQEQKEKRKLDTQSDLEARRTDYYQVNRDKILEANGLNTGGQGEFTCRRCKGTKTTHYSLQTRSADEPMTVFVTCLVRSHNIAYHTSDPRRAAARDGGLSDER